MSGTFREGLDPEGFSGDAGIDPVVAVGSTAREGVLPAGVATGAGFVGSVLLPCLSERFSVLADLGSGGEANVLLVVDDAGERWVVKQYRREGWSPSQEVLERLADARSERSLVAWREDALVRGVVWFQDWGVDPATGLFFEVMEFVEGGSLAGMTGGWPVAELASALASAVSAFHLLVGAHRDIKPANVLVREVQGPVLVLADLGLARELTAGGQRFSKREGSAAYQAPEASQGLVTRAGDWWSVGMILAEVGLGFHPYARGDGSLLPDEVIHAELAQRDVPHLDAIVDDRARLLCRGLLTRDADHRWGRAQVLAWLRGDTPLVVAASRMSVPESAQSPQHARTVLFGGRDFDSPRDLAAAFAADPGRAGELLFLARDQVLLEDLRLMLGAHGLHEAQGYVSSYRSGVWQPSFLRLLVEMDPNLPPKLAGQSMTPEAIADLAVEVLGAGEVTESQRESVRWVVEHDVWRLWRRLPGMSEAPEAAGRLMGFSAGDGVALSGSANVDKETRGPFWDEAAGLGQAWMLWWAVVPEATAEVLNRHLEPLRSGDEVKDQFWWRNLALQVPDSSDGQAIRWAVTAVVGYPLALVAQRDADRRMVEAQEQRERADALRRADIQQVRDVILPWLARQGQAFLEIRRGQLRKELKSARRPSRRVSSEQRVQQVWDSLARLRYSLVHRYGAQFSTPLDDAGFEQSPKKLAVIERELETDPLEWCGWADQDNEGWIPPSPILLAVWGGIEDGRIVGALVDPIARDLVCQLYGELGRSGRETFARTGHGRIRVGGDFFPSSKGESDAVIQQDVVPWSIPGPHTREVEVRCVYKRVEVTQTSTGRCIWAFSTPKPANSNVVFSMPDGELALAALSADHLQTWDLKTGDESSIRLTRSPGANQVSAPETGGAW